MQKRPIILSILLTVATPYVYDTHFIHVFIGCFCTGTSLSTHLSHIQGLEVDSTKWYVYDTHFTHVFHRLFLYRHVSFDTYVTHTKSRSGEYERVCVWYSPCSVGDTYTLVTPLFRIFHYLCGIHLIPFFHRSLFASARLYWNIYTYIYIYIYVSIEETNVAHTEWTDREHQRVSTHYTHRIGLFYRGFSHIDTSPLTRHVWHICHTYKI